MLKVLLCALVIGQVDGSAVSRMVFADAAVVQAGQAQEAPMVDAGEAPAPVEVDVPSAVPEEPSALLELLVRATRQKSWALAAGALLMLFVAMLRALAPNLDKKWLPGVGLASAAVPGLATALMRPEISPLEVATATVAIWLMANGVWAGVVKPLKKKPL